MWWTFIKDELLEQKGMSDNGHEEILHTSFLWECAGVSEMEVDCHTMPPRWSLLISTALNTISVKTLPCVCPSNISFPHPCPWQSTPLYNVLPPMWAHCITNWKHLISGESAPYQYAKIFDGLLVRPTFPAIPLNHFILIISLPAYRSSTNLPPCLITLCLSVLIICTPIDYMCSLGAHICDGC